MVMIEFHDRFYHSQRAKFTPYNRLFFEASLIEKIDQQSPPSPALSPTKKPQISEQVYTESPYFSPEKERRKARSFATYCARLKDLTKIEHL